MKKLLSVMMVLVLMLTGVAMAEFTQSVPELNYAETVFYAGDGIFRIEFMRDVAWRTDYVLTVKDDQDVPVTAQILGGDANEVYVQLLDAPRGDAGYVFSFVSNTGIIRAEGKATQGLAMPNYCEYCLAFGHDEMACQERQAAGVYYDADRCDLCGELGHDEDGCPARRRGEAYCDECASYGHDDDVCPYDADGDDRYDRCDLCGQTGHDDDRCPSRAASSAGTGNAAGGRYCDECGQLGHDDDRCPNERCDECGQLGHDDDRCPNERCDECGRLGHDDDRCPNERCDECGRLGHDDDRCPYDD